MPALTIFKNFTTRPFASDDMHIVCVILSFYRFIQFICLVPMLVASYLERIQGKGFYVNGVPWWCSQYQQYNFTYLDERVPFFKEELDISYEGNHDFWDNFLGAAIAYFCIDVAWIIMVWYSASIGTPTEPMRREKYIRNLVIFKIFLGNIYPIILIILGCYHVWYMRRDNYGCGDGVVTSPQDTGVWYGLFCTLVVTYALELLVWPAIIMNGLVRAFRINIFRNRNRVEGRGGKAERFEWKLGMLLKLLQCITRGKAGGKDLKNKGELTDFASHVMCLLNNQTSLDLVMTDVYVGFRMLSLIQAEMKMKAIKNMSAKNKQLLRKTLDRTLIEEDFGREHTDNPDDNEAVATPPNRKLLRRRGSMFVLEMRDHRFEVCEREVLDESNELDQAAMTDGAHFVRYASYIYVKLPNCVINEFKEGEDEEECSGFKRELTTLFDRDYWLTSIGCDKAMLCYSNFVNGIVATPYCILVDEEVKKIVIAVRGTRSLEDLVVDVQFVPESLERVGKICGFDGDDHYAHKGFLARCKWLYNDIKKNKVLKTLYSEQSPFQDYPLVLCGHSLGAGCASILSLMLRPSFPSLHCFAYEPPGCIFNEELAELCEEFITSYVRQDDLVPRLSFHNFETLREGFFDAFTRIKVPKIKLFFHWRSAPYSASLVAVRNATVLRPKEKVNKNTSFNKKLQLFRAERAAKNNRSVNRVQLYIPGKIIHLVDHSLTGHYVPYYAKRSEFNQLMISNRMYADHDIHSLVDILRETRLGGMDTVSLAFQHAPLVHNEEVDSENDVVLFACCSNPYGKLPILLWALGLAAQALSTAAAADCDFWTTTYTPAILGFNATLTMSFGLYSYGLWDCDSTRPCLIMDDYAEQCVSYPPNWEASALVQAAWALHGLAALSGYVAIFMVMISMCFIFRQRTWFVITVLLLLTTLFQGLVLIVRRHMDWCSDPRVTCNMGSGAVLIIASSCLWFVTAVGAGFLAKVGKRRGAGRKRHSDESPSE